jgi:Ca-activated chloride channel homolog
MLKGVVLKHNFTSLGALLLVPTTRAILLTFFCFTVTGPYVAAQDPTDIEILRVSTDLVVFPVRVRDKNHKRILNLTERDLTLKDEDRVTTSLYLSPGAERVALLFALDESGSLREIVSEQRDTAVALFSRFKQDSRIAVLRFAERPKLVVPFDKDPDQVRSAFNFAPEHNQRTAIFDAAQKAVESFASLPNDPAERRIVVLISDGLDNASSVKPSTVIDAAREHGISFYIIHLPLFEPREGRLAVRSPAKGFRELAEKSGGRYFLIGEGRAFSTSASANDLSPIFQAIADDLKSQYLLGFYVGESARDGHDHRVSISLTRPGLSYSVADRGFSGTHNFSVNMKPKKSPQ